MGAVDNLRLAWQAARDGRPGLRDAMLMLALAESGPDDAAWASRCWRRLASNRAGDVLAGFASWPQATADARIAARLKNLRAMFPPARVRRMLDRAAVLRGPYTGRRDRLAVLLDDLFGPAEPGSLPADPPRARRPAPPQPQAPPLRLGPAPNDPDGELSAFYLSVLVAIAMLMSATLQATDHDRESKAA